MANWLDKYKEIPTAQDGNDDVITKNTSKKDRDRIIADARRKRTEEKHLEAYDAKQKQRFQELDEYTAMSQEERIADAKTKMPEQFKKCQQPRFCADKSAFCQAYQPSNTLLACRGQIK